MGFMDEIKAKARADRKRIVLPETEDERTYRAAAKAIEEDIAAVSYTHLTLPTNDSV